MSDSNPAKPTRGGKRLWAGLALVVIVAALGAAAFLFTTGRMESVELTSTELASTAEEAPVAESAPESEAEADPEPEPPSPPPMAAPAPITLAPESPTATIRPSQPEETAGAEAPEAVEAPDTVEAPEAIEEAAPETPQAVILEPIITRPAINEPMIVMRDGTESDSESESVGAMADEPAAEALAEDTLDIVEVFFGTDRADKGPPGAPAFTGDRGRALTLGSVEVSVPRRHTPGRVERPWSRTLFGVTVSGREDPEQHFIIQGIEVLDRDGFIARLRDVVDASEGFEDQVLVFVHGFNVSFDAAAYRTAQIAYDLEFDGAAVFYSWPSRGNIADYEYDQNSARQARRYLGDFLELVRAESGAETIHLIAHSMGNDPLMEVLAQTADRNRGAGPLFNEIILAAPDIDVDLFTDLAERVRGISTGMTLYASGADRALQVSRAYARGVPRAGDVPDGGPVVVSGIDTIDITEIGAALLSLNHSEYAENRELLDDIGVLLKLGTRPPIQREPSLREIQLGEAVYWQFAP